MQDAEAPLIADKQSETAAQRLLPLPTTRVKIRRSFAMAMIPLRIGVSRADVSKKWRRGGGHNLKDVRFRKWRSFSAVGPNRSAVEDQGVCGKLDMSPRRN